jgi:hypothetical protein
MSDSSGEQMVLGPEAFNCGIQKKLIYPGKTPIEFVDGTKVFNKIKNSMHKIYSKHSPPLFLI